MLEFEAEVYLSNPAGPDGSVQLMRIIPLRVDAQHSLNVSKAPDLRATNNEDQLSPYDQIYAMPSGCGRMTYESSDKNLLQFILYLFHLAFHPSSHFL